MPLATATPAWSWLLGTTASGAFRHAPFRAQDPGQGQDPALEPRVEVIRRLIAYPGPAFDAVVGAVIAADRDPRRPIRWACHRAAGDAPARPYWISFLRAKPEGGRRFVVGLELFDRDRIGLWFLSGFVDRDIAPDVKAPFPDMPEVSLPRFLVANESIAERPFARWIQLAFEDALVFDAAASSSALAPSSASTPGSTTDASGRIEQTIAPNYAAAVREDVDLRSARARLIVCQPGTTPRIVPLARLATSFGRDQRQDVVIDERTISFEHARIVWREGTPSIEDLGSKNGTRVEDAVVRKGTPLELPDEALVAIGRVPCLFVRDAEETLPPGATATPRHEPRLRQLLDQQKIRAEDAEKARADARARGITPGEALVLAGKVTPEVWRNRPSVAASGGGGCLVLAATIATALGAAAATVLLYL